MFDKNITREKILPEANKGPTVCCHQAVFQLVTRLESLHCTTKCLWKNYEDFTKTMKATGKKLLLSSCSVPICEDSGTSGDSLKPFQLHTAAVGMFLPLPTFPWLLEYFNSEVDTLVFIWEGSSLAAFAPKNPEIYSFPDAEGLPYTHPGVRAGAPPATKHS